MAKLLWTPEQDDQLRNLKAQKKTAQQIALIMHKNRNAVIGRANRLGLTKNIHEELRKRREIANLKRVTRAEKRRRKTLTKVIHSPEDFPSQLPPEPPPAAAKKAFGEPCLCEDLQLDSCRWPFAGESGPRFLFCNATAQAPFPYCQHHAAVAYK